MRHPAKAVERARGAVDLLGPPLVSPAPSSPLNVQIGTHRRVHWVAMELDALKGVKNRFGGTVNDVVLTVVTQALRRWLQKRGVSPDGLELRAMVPVSVRADDEKYQLGNKVAAMRGPLPVGVEDPVESLRTVSGAMTGLKESKQALGAEVLADLQEFAPPTLLSEAARINFSTRLFNCIVTNVPGPQFPIYLLGRELEELIPMAFLPKDHALAFAIMSYNGKVDFGLIGDYDKLADIGFVARALEESLADLTERADYSQSADGRARVRAKVAGG